MATIMRSVVDQRCNVVSAAMFLTCEFDPGEPRSVGAGVGQNDQRGALRLRSRVHWLARKPISAIGISRCQPMWRPACITSCSVLGFMSREGASVAPCPFKRRHGAGPDFGSMPRQRQSYTPKSSKRRQPMQGHRKQDQARPPPRHSR